MRAASGARTECSVCSRAAHERKRAALTSCFPTARKLCSSKSRQAAGGDDDEDGAAGAKAAST